MTNAEVLKVLVPIDFSETSRRALAWAYDYALRAPCELHLVHVIEGRLMDVLIGPARERINSDMSAISREVESELERMVPAADDRASMGTIVSHVASGRAAAEILAVADKIGAEMIVMGTHGRTGVDRLLIGSVAENVVRHAACPVVCVKPVGRLAA